MGWTFKTVDGAGSWAGYRIDVGYFSSPVLWGGFQKVFYSDLGYGELRELTYAKPSPSTYFSDVSSIKVLDGNGVSASRTTNRVSGSGISAVASGGALNVFYFDHDLWQLRQATSTEATIGPSACSMALAEHEAKSRGG
jgi:hypothetical protein